MARKLPPGVRRLASGAYQGTVEIPRSDPRKRVTETFGVARDAGEWVADTRSAMRRGEWRDPKAGQELCGAWIGRWMDARNVEPETLVADWRIIRRHVLPKWGALPLAAPLRLEVQGWVTGMVRAGMGGPIIRRAYGLFSAAMTAAVDEGILAATPCRKITVPQPVKRPPKWWTPQQVEQLVARLTEPWATIACLMAWCGLRWEEAAALQVDAVDWLRREVTVLRVVTDARRIKEYPKNGEAGVRTVKMAGPVAAVLRPAWDAAAAARGEDGLIWQAADGRPLALTSWGKYWRRMVLIFEVRHRPAVNAKEPWEVFRGKRPVARYRTERQARTDAAQRRAGLVAVPYHSPHTLRHSGASWLAQAGVSLDDIGLWLGHERGSSATRIYAHLCPEKSGATVGEALAKLESTASPGAVAK